MRSQPWWVNLIGELLFAFFLMGVTEWFAWMSGSTVPPWGAFLAAMVGLLLWRKVDYSRPQDLQT